MSEDSNSNVNKLSNLLDKRSAGEELRHEVLQKITPILRETEEIGDSQKRLAIQACCLDVVTGLEEVIERFRLDRCNNK